MSKILPETLKPVNRHLLVIPHRAEKKTESGVLLPEDFKPQEDRYVVATVMDVASDCNSVFRCVRSAPNTRVVIDNTMVEEVRVRNKVHYLILENYVVGLLRRLGNED